MGFSISTERLPSFRNFERASEYERSVKPIRGKTIKPLRNDRRGHHMQILRYNEGTDQEAIACRLYHTDCVTFRKDGTVHLSDGGYTTQSTAKFINRVYYGGRVVQKDNHMMFMHGGGVCAIPRAGLIIGKEGQLTNVQPFKVHKVNKAAMKAVRAQYKPFMQYARNMLKLHGPEFTFEEWRTTYQYTIREPITLPEGDDMEQWAASLERLFLAAIRSTYSYAARKTTYIAQEASLKNVMKDAMLRQHRNTVFEEVTLPLGEYKKDTYAKYFK
jgi:hypothetical protein